MDFAVNVHAYTLAQHTVVEHLFIMPLSMGIQKRCDNFEMN